ncbi:MAG: F0F1 ATP synthase subunit A [Candidatus Aminicenantes bacterium]|nr:MAG: F0F1 ATP synthase subunit A [Candidatus Aminicenantes bacterium]
MEELEHSLFIVELFNKIFSKPLSSLFSLVGIEVHNPEHLIPDYVVMSLIVAVILILFLGLSSRKLTPVPSKLQSVLELIIQAFEGLLTDIIGEGGKRYLPLIATIGLFIFSCNILGLAPGMMSPTSKLNVTVGCALVVFFYYHWQGIKSQGLFKYLKHFTGPIPLLAPLFFPIEVISHFSRPVSLSLRLFGNIFAEELLIVVMASIIPFFLPLPFMVIAILTATIQAGVFVLLSCVYIGGAVAHEEEH